MWKVQFPYVFWYLFGFSSRNFEKCNSWSVLLKWAGIPKMISIILSIALSSYQSFHLDAGDRRTPYNSWHVRVRVVIDFSVMDL